MGMLRCWLGQALRLDSGDDVTMRGKLLYRRGLAHLEMKQYDKAVADLEDASLRADKVGRRLIVRGARQCEPLACCAVS